MLIRRAVRPKADPPNSRRQKRQGLLEHPQVVETGADVAVAELRAQQQSLLTPIDVERLVSPKTLVTMEGIPLVGLDQRGVKVEGGDGLHGIGLSESDELGVENGKSAQAIIRRGNESVPPPPKNLLRPIVKRTKPAENRRGRGKRALPAPTKTTRKLTPLPPRKTMRLRLPKQTAKTRVSLQNVNVVNALAAPKIQKDQRTQQLKVREPLRTSPRRQNALRKLPKTPGLKKSKKNSQARPRGNPIFPGLLFVVERKNALRHHSFTSLVMVLSCNNTIISRIHGTNEVYYFLGGGFRSFNGFPVPPPLSWPSRIPPRLVGNA